MNNLRHTWMVVCLLAVVAQSVVVGRLWSGEVPEIPLDPPVAGRTLPPPRNFVRLDKDYEVWMDAQRGMVVVDGEVVLREGLLEMFACPKETKEHESIIAVNCKARFVHAGLLAVGAAAGRPVQFQPTYVAASGTTVEIWILWQTADGKRNRVRAQEWIKDMRTGKAMAYEWVFAGSGFWTDESDGKRYYYGDGGDFICVSNFPSATLDLPVKSSDANDELTFAAFTERIPPRGTKVRLVLIPRLEKAEKATPPKLPPSESPGETKGKSPA